MKRSQVTLIGFILLFMGFLSIFLSLVGLNLEFLGFLYQVGAGFAFLIYILMIMFGGILIYVSKTNSE